MNIHDESDPSSPGFSLRLLWADRRGMRKAIRELREESLNERSSRRRRDRHYEDSREWPDDPTED